MTLEEELKHLIISELKIRDVVPAELDDDDPIFGGKLGLDSVDALELIVILKKRFGVELKNRNEARVHLESVATLAAYLRAARGPSPPRKTP